MKVRLNIISEEQRRQVVYALASNGYPVYIEGGPFNIEHPQKKAVVVEVDNKDLIFNLAEALLKDSIRNDEQGIHGTQV